MNTFEYAVLAISSLFVILDPIAIIPAFLAMTATDSPEQRTRMARLACTVACGILLMFAITGKALFNFLGISMAAFQMAGSIVLLLIALDMLRAQRSRVQETPEETEAGSQKTDIAITPLGVPMLAGPGAISTVILLHAKASNLPQQLTLLACIIVTCAASYLVFLVSSKGAKWLSPIMLSLTTRIMGLLLAAVAMQFLVNAFKELGIIR